jgi:uncharacterized Tic20 family protein
MTMENNEQTPEPVEKPEGQTPAQEEVSEEKSKSQTPVTEKVSAEKSESEASVKQEVCSEKAGTVNESPGSKEINKDARMWAMICHLAGLAGIILPASGNIVAPLIIWQIKKDSNPFIDEQGKEAVNFQISMSIYLIASIILSFICIGVPLIIATIIVFFVFMLIAAVKANNGYHYRYPLTMRFIK